MQAEYRMNKWLGQIESMVTSATSGMTEDQLTWRPEGKWSAADILEHLTKTYMGTTRGYEKAITVGRSLATSSQPKRAIARFTLLKLGYFPPGRKSPERVVPTLSWSGREALANLRAELAKMIDAQHQAEQKHPAYKPIMDHPILGPMSPVEWARFHYIHARHHMKQIAAIKRQVATARSASA
jgi:hypothetical protein